MQVEHKMQVDTLHSIEIGKATWDNDKISIRNRYDLPNGKFSQHNSSEIPIGDLAKLVKFSCEHDVLSADELQEIIIAATQSLSKHSKLIW